MKLRILGDTLRLRLSQSDVRALADTGLVQETTHFAAGRALVYAIARDSAAAQVSAAFEQDRITVRVPEAQLASFVGNESEVTMAAEQATDGGHSLSMLIEKDFKCAITRPGEENYDGFPNPNVSC